MRRPYDLQQVLKWALQASTRETSDYLIQKGKRDASAWLTATGLADVLAEEQRQSQTPQLQQQHPLLHLEKQGSPPKPHSHQQARAGEQAEAAAAEQAAAEQGSAAKPAMMALSPESLDQAIEESGVRPKLKQQQQQRQQAEV